MVHSFSTAYGTYIWKITYMAHVYPYGVQPILTDIM